MKAWSLLGNSQKLDGGAMFGNAPKAMWEKWVDVDDLNRIDLACRALLVAMAIAFGNGIGSGMMMTLGADHSPRDGRAHFLGLWRLMADVGASCGPVLLSLLAATLTLGAGIAATGVMAVLAAGHLAYWIPRAQARTGEAERH